jgi:hypothetical protein
MGEYFRFSQRCGFCIQEDQLPRHVRYLCLRRVFIVPSRQHTTIHILYYVIVPGVQLHVSAYIEAIVGLHTQNKGQKFNNCAAEIY